jgi:hypothetical protein
MKRYIKTNNKWIDTLQMQKEGYYYYVIDGLVWCLEENKEYLIAKLQKETDNKEETNL